MRTDPLTDRVARYSIAAFTLLLVYDGALRKWVLPSAEQVIFVAKDVLLLAGFVFVALNRRTRPSLVPLGPRNLFALYAAWVALQAGNLALPSPLVGIWGIKSHLLYATLLVLVPLAFRSVEDLFRSIARWYPWLTIPVCSVAFLQITSPPDAFINQSVRGGMDAIATFGEAHLVRVTGTFSYISGMGSFLQVGALVGMAAYISGVRTRLFLVGFGFTLAALPSAGSRGVIVTALAGAMVMLASAFFAGLITTRVMARTLLATVVLGALSLLLQDDAWMALKQRAEDSASDENRALTAFTNAFEHFEEAGAIGFGTGSANLGSPALVRNLRPFSWLPNDMKFEEESGRIVIELGVLGWLLSLVMRAALLVWSIRLTLRGHGRWVRTAGVFALPTMASSLYLGNGVFAPPIQSAFFWVCVALLGMAEFENRSMARARIASKEVSSIADRHRSPSNWHRSSPISNR